VANDNLAYKVTGENLSCLCGIVSGK